MTAPGFRGTALLAVAGAGWAAVLLAPHPTVRVVVPLVFAAGALLMGRFPVAGATVIGLGQGAGLLLGAPHDNPSGLVAGLGAMYLLGHRSRLPWALPPILLAWAVIVLTDLSSVRQVLGLALFGVAFGLGAGVRIRTRRTGAAEEELRRLEDEEVSTRAARIVTAERQRLAGDSARLLTAATQEMRDLARSAGRDLDPTTIDRVRERGEAAVAGLRMLRTPAPTTDTSPPPAADTARPRWPIDVGLAALVSLLLVAEWAVDADQTRLWPWLLVVTASTAAVRRVPGVACLLAAVGFVGQWSTGEPFVVGPAVALAVGLLTWHTVAVPRPSSLAALATLLGAGLLATVPHGSTRPALLASILLLAGIGSRLWHLLDDRHVVATSRATAYTRWLRIAVDSAVAEERLGVARDLHDVASRAIGVMLLHASAAKVHHTARPERARDALATVVAAGDEALTELDSLERSLAPDEGSDLRSSLGVLVERMRGAGLDVGWEMSTRVRDAETAEVAWRVVNEALTNALKHAPGARVEVDVHREGDDLVVTVRDHGSARGGLHVGTGLGLQGLHELVTRSGGTLRHTPVPAGRGGGFEVVARLPESAVPSADAAQEVAR